MAEKYQLRQYVANGSHAVVETCDTQGDVGVFFDDLRTVGWFRKKNEALAEAARLNASERKRDAASAMYEALKDMMETHGMHGPCKGNSCRDCNWAFQRARAALRLADGEFGSSEIDAGRGGNNG